MLPRLLAIAVVFGCAGVATAAPRVHYFLDAERTEILVDLVLFGTPMQGGFAKKSGRFAPDDSAGAAALDLAVETASVQAPDPGDVEKLRGESFFHVDRYPRASLVVDKLPLTEAGAASAVLALHGHTARIQLKSGGPQCQAGAAGGPEICRWLLQGDIPLRDYDMDSVLPGTPTTARLTVKLAALRSTDAPAEPAAASVAKKPKAKRRR